MADQNSQDKKTLRSVFIEATGDSSVDMGEQLATILQKSTIRPEGPLASLMKGVSVMGEKKENKGIKLAFYEDPVESSDYSGIFKTKRKLLPDHVLKLIRVQNHLVASILRARGNTLAMFGHKRHDRFDVGFEVEIKPEFETYIKPEQMNKIKERIEKAEKLLLNCGSTENLNPEEKMSLSDFLDLQARNALTFGRFATEIIRTEENGESVFHSFRPVDVGTIYSAVRKGEYGGDAIREGSIKRLEQVTGEKLDPKMFESDEYAFVQAINGTPVQAFTSDELLVFNMFPSTDIEHAGYPVTPIDTCISSVTTHLSIDAYNRLYFQNGRAAKGMLVVKSNEIDQATIQKIRQDFMASINNVNNAFRAPVFGVNPEDDVAWIPMTSNAGDGEFQFLYDNVSRVILSTFNISPDELPGYSHLSRGTNQQTLSESSNEFKLTAARDTGLRPLILKFQSFLNEKLLPIIDPELAQICYVQLSGLDSQTREQESLRLQQDSPIHMSYDDVMSAVDKQPIGKRLAGGVPFNERYQIISDKLLNVSELRDAFLEDPTALVDTMLQFKRDPFWLQHMNLLMQVNPAAVKAYYASKPYAMEILKMMVEDQLEEDDQ